MGLQVKTVAAAVLLVTLAATPVLAKGGWKGAPGPAAGAGIGYLMLAGGYYLVQRWRKNNTDK